MWKLFQSLLKNFRVSGSQPFGRGVSTASQDNPTVSNNDYSSEDDDDHPVSPPNAISPTRESNRKFPQIVQPTIYEYNAGNTIQLPKISIDNVNTPGAQSKLPRDSKPSMGSLHSAMGLKALQAGDKETAVQHFKVAADNYGWSKANYNLGVLYQFHFRDAAEAIKRYQMAGDHPDALYNLAFLTLTGPHASALLPKASREKEALTLLRRSARLGSKEV